MKNLKLSWQVSSEVQLQSDDVRKEFIRLSTVDVERNRLFFASSAGFIYSTQIASPQIEGTFGKVISPAKVDLEDGDAITCLEYLMEKESLMVGTSNGLLLLYSVDDHVTEVVGSLEGGVCCISPSPDGDILAMVTGFGQILVMNLDWDVLYEVPLDDSPEDFDVHNSATSDDYYHEALISWRGDGKFFASLSKVHSNPLHKKLKVWERDSGTLCSVSEPKPFMGMDVDWTQTGAKIAAVYDMKKENKCPSVVLFEKNCLERSSFSVEEDINVSIQYLRFNCNSDLLAAVVRGKTFDTLKIWFFSNNHWYVKHEIRYSNEDKVNFMWDPTKPLQLTSWTLDGRITTYKFVWVTAVMDNSVAFVVDGSKVLVTPLSLSLIPPPMYFLSLEFPCAVREMIFSDKVSQYHLAATLSDGSLCIAELPLLDQWDELEGKAFKVEPSHCSTDFGSHLHLAWLDSRMLVSVPCLSNHSKTSLRSEDLRPSCYLQEIQINCSEDRLPGSITSSGWQSEIVNQINLEGVVIGIASNPLTRYSAFVQFDGGQVFEYMSKLSSNREIGLLRRDNMGFLQSCPWMGTAHVAGYARDKPLLLGLDDNGKLHLERKILCNNCGSFSFYSSSNDGMVTHLILSTKQDLLFIVDVDDIIEGSLEQKYGSFLPVISKGKKTENDNNSINIWERGARIIGVLNGDESAVILQTPRGNLECVYPRRLVLASIVNSLAQRRFRDALVLVRRHRIDFNVIVDHCGFQGFIDSAADFVVQVGNLSHITEFVCGIKNENVMETLYSNYKSSPKGEKVLGQKEPNSIDGKDKVNLVLVAIEKALKEKIPETPERELCILTTLAKRKPPALEEALRRIKDVRESELSSIADPRRASYPSSEESLKHLLWLSDPEPVFEAALGLYDLNLAAIVALNSQRDPKEFLPYLQELERMPKLLMQYSIDLKLKRYESALRHVVSAGDPHYEDCLNLIKKVPELYPLGIRLIGDSCRKMQILEAWGDHLTSIKSFEEAASTYLCCLCYEKASKAYRALGNWKGVLTVSGLMKLSKDILLQDARELSEELQALGKPGEAAKLLLEYCGDINGGVSLLVEARHWEEALRICFLHQRDDLVLLVKNASLECANALIGEYNEGSEKVGKYLTRYLAVRQRRLLLAATIQSDQQQPLDDETSSQASSNYSGMSAYTTGTKKFSNASNATTSTKGRGRQRNRGKIRAGSPDEEMALVDHLKGMTLTEGAKTEIKTLLISLLMLGEEEISRKLQRTCEKFQLSQIAAVKLAEDAMSTNSIDEQALVLDRYVQNARSNAQNFDAFSWQLKVLM